MDQSSVALLIDWENIKKSAKDYLNAPPDIILLKKIARRYGSLTLCRAYANWSDGQHEGDMERFSYQEIEPVFVQTKRRRDKGELVAKGSSDIRLACDCIEMLFKNPGISTFVVASGDAGFEHVVAKLKAHGKKAIMIGIRQSTGGRLETVSEGLVWYDDWVSGLKVGGEGNPNIGSALVEFKRAVEDARREKTSNSLKAIKERIKKKISDFEEENLGFSTFRHLAYLAELRKDVKIDGTVTPACAYLPDEAQADNGARLHPGVKWQKFIQALTGNTSYKWSDLAQIVKEKDIYLDDTDISDFIDSALRSGCLWFKYHSYVNSKTGAIVDSAKEYFLDLTNPKVQVYQTVR
ncbi:MAG: NYN domain-containing protein [Deltaproteobacteria bacterium]|nr:NYN domain-containing protein [Deltaproteobacteria bacterium]